MLTVDRLVDGINGEDPGGARLYMSQLRENEVGFPDSSIQNAMPEDAACTNSCSSRRLYPLYHGPREGLHLFCMGDSQSFVLACLQVSVCGATVGVHFVDALGRPAVITIGYAAPQRCRYVK